MKIDPSFKSSPATRLKETRSDKSRAKVAREGSSSVSDEVQLTDQATLLGELEAKLANFDVTDPALIEAVQAAIRDGNFVVDTEKVAENLVQESIELINRQLKP